MRISAEDKIVTEEPLKQRLQQARAQGRTIVWTNGVFDILHAGHITYLERAAALGDVLVVGLNTDASVQLNKGPLRPIVPERERARLLAALACVDYVILYGDQSPVELIGRLKPDIYAKGGDYNLDTINQPERRLMERLGGRIELLPGVPGLSTSAIIERILKAYRT
ncbi:MAG TPA: adenylyltransferase/cytidyltransferase family protein [bacterium]|nr:adenylyltransferase/cytidyltransferase family protein [bacterium]HQG46565.1 adenylyltransferase/cytidyltransferase family protein [bacterium]HQI48263.1 adenylyltransferase/cytidyltransferase family protein [bacterium]HQJ65995.1 adenylyltransferase/cytidyltransferase family protein [bacterium]